MKANPQSQFAGSGPNAPSLTLRNESRRQVFRAAIIIFGPDATQVPCSILNISSSGARITTKWASKLPDRFQLMNKKYRLDVECEVRWQLEDDLGLRFLSSEDMPSIAQEGTGASKRTQITKIKNPRPASAGKSYI